MSYKVRYDYRVKKKNGEYIRILQQVIAITFDKEGRILRTFGVHTDITHLKQEGTPVLSFIGLNGEPSFTNIAANIGHFPLHNELTAREREVLNLIIQGNTNQGIGELLHISIFTVQTHRRNIMRKTSCSNTATLTTYTIKNGLI